MKNLLWFSIELTEFSYTWSRNILLIHSKWLFAMKKRYFRLNPKKRKSECLITCATDWKPLQKTPTSKFVTTDYLLQKIHCYCETHYTAKEKLVSLSTFQKVIFWEKNLWKFKIISGSLPPTSESKGVTNIK